MVKSWGLELDVERLKEAAVESYNEQRGVVAALLYIGLVLEYAADVLGDIHEMMSPQEEDDGEIREEHVLRTTRE